jgi:hypothetical protein
MAYNIKDVFFLGNTQEYTNGAWQSKDSVQPIDVSAYVDPISKGRQRGQGLAVYRVSGCVSSGTTGTPVDASESTEFTVGLSVKPFTTTGDILSGAVSGTDLVPSSDLLIQGMQFYGIAGVGSGGNPAGFHTFLEPTSEVPYVVVRDTIYQIASMGSDIVADLSVSYRMECAMITLDTATLNQLLRTQTA